MATSKTLELSIKIAGRMDKSLTAAINGTQSKIGSLTKSISNIGTVGLATMGAVATAAAVGIADCTKEAQALESAMAPVVRYVDGLADASGAVSDAIADNGKTFKQNYGALKTYIQDLSTEIPRTTDQLTAMSAALGQSGIGVDKQLTTGYLRDTAVSATAMDLDDQTAGNYVAKWEASFNFDHKQVMELMDQINYLGAHNATTAAEIAQSVNSAASMGQIAGVDPAATAAMATAMQATGVTTDRVGTSISRIYTNLSKGSNATKAQKEMWEELGFTAEGIAKSMQTDGVGTLKEVFTALQDMPDERKVAALSTLFGQWAIEGGAKITNNLGAYEKALAMVSDPSLYTGSMEREFIIQASTSESIDTMVKNSVTALKQDIGTEFLPVKKTLSLAVIDLMNGVRKDMPQLQTLAGTLADLLSAGISKLGDALQAALPYVQKALDYVADNGPQVAGILGGMAGTFAAMKFAPLAGNLLEGAGSLLFGESGGLGVAAGGSERSGGLLGAVGSLFTGGQKFAGNAVGTISNVAEAAGVGATMANSNMTRTQWGAVTSNGSGSFMQRLENSAIGAYFGIKNRGTLTNQKGTDYKFMQGLMGVAGQITDAKQGGGLLGMAKNAVTSSPIGQYFGGIRAAAGNVANTTIGSKIVGFGKGTIGVSKEILAGIAGPEGLGLTNLVSGAKGLAQNGAGWVAGKAGNVISTVANSGVGQAIGGAAGRVGGVAKGVVSVGSNALGALGNFAGAGAGLLGSVWGPVAGGFGSLFAGAAPVIAAIEKYGLTVYDGKAEQEDKTSMNISITKKTSTHNTTAAAGRAIRYIVVHYTAGVTSKPGSAAGTASYFGGTSKQVSADFIVDDGGAVQYNGDIRNRYTWHCGGGKYNTKGGAYYGKATNRNTIGIEVCSTNDTGKMTVANDSHWSFTDKVVSNLVELVKCLMAEYGIDATHVIRHYDVNGKPCPGIIGWNEDTGSAAKWAAFKARLGAATPGGQIGGSTNTGTATGNTALTYKVGDIVQFAGGKHYANAQATSGTTVKPGPAKVTAVATAGKHPYHLVHTDGTSTVYGWVDAAAITGKASATPAVKTYTVKAGDSLWRIAAQQLGNGARYKEIKTLNGLKNNTIHAGQVLKLPN